jgi:hypothetical protein
MEDRRHTGIFLGICGVLILFFGFGNIALTGAVIGTNTKTNFTIFTILGIILIAIFLIIESQESGKIKKRKK